MIRDLGTKSPRIHPTAFVSEAAYVVGDVEIGENSSIWPGAVLRGDYGKISVGKNTNVQDNCVLHSDDHLYVGDNVVVTHGAVLHCRRVGNNVMIGINAVLLENVEIGDNCMIAAGSVVLSGTVIENGSVVIGVPGSARPLKSQYIKRIRDSVNQYRNNAKRFKKANLG